MGVELQPQTDPAATATAGPACRFCGAHAGPHLRRPRHVAPVRELRARGPRRGHGAVLPAARADLRPLPPRPAGGVRRPRGDLHGVRVLLVVLGLAGWHHARRQRRVGGRPVRPRRRQPRRRAGQQRRLPAPARRRARHPGAGHRARRERRRGRPGAGDRNGGRVLRPPTSRPASPQEGRQADLLVANNVFAHVPDLNDFVAGMRAAARAPAAWSRSSSRTCCG